MELLGDKGHMESDFFSFGDSVISVQDMCMVCPGRTVGLEIVLDAPDGTTRRRGPSGSFFQSIWR